MNPPAGGKPAGSNLEAAKRGGQKKRPRRVEPAAVHVVPWLA